MFDCVGSVQLCPWCTRWVHTQWWWDGSKGCQRRAVRPSADDARRQRWHTTPCTVSGAHTQCTDALYCKIWQHFADEYWLGDIIMECLCFVDGSLRRRLRRSRSTSIQHRRLSMKAKIAPQLSCQVYCLSVVVFEEYLHSAVTMLFYHVIAINSVFLWEITFVELWLRLWLKDLRLTVEI